MLFIIKILRARHQGARSTPTRTNRSCYMGIVVWGRTEHADADPYVHASVTRLKRVPYNRSGCPSAAPGCPSTPLFVSAASDRSCFVWAVAGGAQLAKLGGLQRPVRYVMVM
eukprot:1178507-Prorocentrum_minimum.AAC.2